MGMLALLCLVLMRAMTTDSIEGPRQVSPSKSQVWGPGLNPAVVTPARYLTDLCCERNFEERIQVIRAGELKNCVLPSDCGY